MPRAFVHRITKYDPADRDERGHYAGTEDPDSDHGPVEAAYLAAIAAFAEASGIDRLEIREPSVTGLDAVARTRALGLFPEPLTASPCAAEFGEREPAEPDSARGPC